MLASSLRMHDVTFPGYAERRLVVEVIASEAFGDILAVQVQIEWFSQGEALDFMIYVPRWNCLPPERRRTSLACVLLWCFIGC